MPKWQLIMQTAGQDSWQCSYRMDRCLRWEPGFFAAVTYQSSLFQGQIIFDKETTGHNSIRKPTRHTCFLVTDKGPILSVVREVAWTKNSKKWSFLLENRFRQAALLLQSSTVRSTAFVLEDASLVRTPRSFLAARAFVIARSAFHGRLNQSQRCAVGQVVFHQITSNFTLGSSRDSKSGLSSYDSSFAGMC